ncbi:hypothetical protein PCK1_003184 [Pneumocystis canis]|nr:hypothetical protein PCK1_003184 [Pneumocystis canis]
MRVKKWVEYRKNKKINEKNVVLNHRTQSHQLESSDFFNGFLKKSIFLKDKIFGSVSNDLSRSSRFSKSSETKYTSSLYNKWRKDLKQVFSNHHLNKNIKQKSLYSSFLPNRFSFNSMELAKIDRKNYSSKPLLYSSYSFKL